MSSTVSSAPEKPNPASVFHPPSKDGSVARAAGIFAQARKDGHCSCATEASMGLHNLRNSTEITLDSAITATSQVLGFSNKVQQCLTCQADPDVWKNLLQIYQTLLDYLDECFKAYGPGSADELHNPAYDFNSSRRTSASRMSPATSSRREKFPSQSSFTCKSISMLLGDHALDSQQCRLVALELVSHTLTDLAASLQEVRSKDEEQFAGPGKELDAIFARAVELLHSCSVALSTR
ncbi:hypothetical protein K461DRAFT_278983 [Myriangium duriaei CBS 260.36]|uniref:Uncharacterized protein n=1 Tax=Myriangium duriaei CBS 260.36 TaxID=1168546 RepID=A0A9P4J3T7_9PEZI|nr:hypothetical protein K461DRAFT_278983 [Myriangium duriaei CBS 260.36]